MLTRGYTCYIKLSKNIVLNHKDGPGSPDKSRLGKDARLPAKRLCKKSGRRRPDKNTRITTVKKVTVQTTGIGQSEL